MANRKSAKNDIDDLSQTKPVPKRLRPFAFGLGVATVGFFTFLTFKSVGHNQVGIRRNGTNISISFDATAGGTYRLERTLDLTNVAWQSIPGVNDLVATNDGSVTITDSNALVQSKAFYRVKEMLPCDVALASNSANPVDYARAMELCETTTEQSGEPGIISAELTLASGTGSPDARSRAIRTSFGSGNLPQAGASMVVLSTGAAAAKGQVNPSFVAFQNGLNTGTSSDAPADWLAANNGTFPNAPGCPAPVGTGTQNPVMLTLRIRVPDNANSFAVSAKFFTSEYPEYMCSPFNDIFIALLDSSYSGINANPADKNIATYDFNGGKYPMSVNLANVGLLTQCVNGRTGCSGSIPGTMTSCTGTGGLTGTGMDDPAPNLCDPNSQVGGGTDWLTLRGNVVPGEIITLRFAIWDTSDGLFDSLVLLDNFQWSSSTTIPGMFPQ